MTVGLPGTGIGGIFYMLLAIYMPVSEFFHTLKGKTTLRRWGFITLQLLFVSGVVAAMWSELWLVNRVLIWVWGIFKINGPLLMQSASFRETKFVAMAAAYMSFISLTFVITAMHVLRFFVHRSRCGKHLTIQKSHPVFDVLASRSMSPDTP
jgi:hypothetical protein